MQIKVTLTDMDGTVLDQIVVESDKHETETALCNAVTDAIGWKFNVPENIGWKSE